ncbi:MAG: S8 family serine peptidase [Elusimicrobia bacterium]|nr:S8 family serine peptidase [Elusimicrobiota bacterium]
MKKNPAPLIALFISLCASGASAQTVAGKVVVNVNAGMTTPAAIPVRVPGQVGSVSFDVSPVSLRGFSPSVAAPAVQQEVAVPVGNAVPEAVRDGAPWAGAQAGIEFAAVPSVVPAVPGAHVPDASPGAPGVAELLGMKEELSIDGEQLAEMPADQARASGEAVMNRVLGIKAVPSGAEADLMSGSSFSGSASHARSNSSRSRGRKGMPVEDDRANDDGPDGTDGLDELGNPRRRQDDGPDSVSDEFGGDRGGDSGAFLGSPADVSIQVGMLGAPQKNSGQTVDSDRPVVFIVEFSGRDDRKLKADSFLSSVDVTKRHGVQAYAALQNEMLLDIEALGVDRYTLSDLGATPTATIRRINSAIFRVSSGRVQEFVDYMASRGHKVYENDSRKIVKPIPVTPENVDPTAPSAVTLDETLKIVRAGKAHQAAGEMWGPPELGPVGRLAMKVAGWLKPRGKPIPQPKVAVIDTGADTSHPMLKGVTVKNETSGENIDDIGHGSWVTADVLNIGRWLKNVTHYKTFSNGGATLEDILKSLTDAGNDGNIIMSNSWGSDEGDPDSPDSQLVRKLAEEGRVMVFAAGNSGPGKNTIGSPAIVYYKDAKTGAIRVLSVAASDRKKKIVYFSSRGPGSWKTKDDPDYPHRPDLTSVGHNKESAWPRALGDADRTDPVYGPMKALSGTSMSAPDIAGAIAHLAQLFGVTELGEKLDAVVNAVMSTLEDAGAGPDLQGKGFIDMDAAYEMLKKTLKPQAPGFVARMAALVARWIDGYLG